MSVEHADQTPSPVRRRISWQWHMSTLLLVLTAIAIGMATYKTTRDSARLQHEIAVMQPLTRELVVTNPQQFAVVQPNQEWYDDSRWHVYLPAAGSYQLKLATREIADKGVAPASWQYPIRPGRHELSFIKEKLPDSRTRLVISVDDVPVIDAVEEADWSANPGFSGEVFDDETRQLPTKDALVLMRRRYMLRQPDGSSSTPQSPAFGILIWIESAELVSPGPK